MDAKTVAETLRQVIEGRDFDTPAKLVRIKADKACQQPEHAPYSIATNVWHCDYWNRLWLAKLTGEKRAAGNIWSEDWKVPAASDWEEVSRRFIANLDRALTIAQAEPFSHKMKSDEEAVKTLNQIAVHTAYHLGQIALLRRILRAKV